jgi:hypothetical protein
MIQNFTATIAASGTISEGVFIDGYRVSDIFCPVTTGTAITFEVSTDGSTWVDYKNTSNALVTVTKTAGSASSHQFPAGQFEGIQWVKVKSGSTEASARTFTLVGVK